MTSAKTLFEDEEIALLKQVAKRDNIDLENSSDLIEQIDPLEQLAPQKTPEEIAQLPQDKIFTKKEDFSFADFLPENESFVPISEERRKELEKENHEILNGYLLWQSMQPDFKLHVLLGRNDETGESTWFEKSFKYHPVTKGQRLRLQLKQSRINDLIRKKDELRQKPYSELSTEQQFELTYFNTLVNIASYKLEELQAKLYFHMTDEDFATVNTAEYTWALSAAQYKESYSPFSSPKQQPRSLEAKT